MRRISTLLVALFVCFALPGNAERATVSEMEQVCVNWLDYMVGDQGDWGGSTTPTIAETTPIVVDGRLLGQLYHIAPQGHIIVPVMKEMPPVKAYSDRYDLDMADEDGPALLIREMLASRADLFVDAYGSLDAVMPDRADALFGTTHRQLWDTYAQPTAQFRSELSRSGLDERTQVGPLLTSSWHQGAPYNLYAPEGDGGQCVVGCVATAIAQVTAFWSWPPIGAGSSSYVWNGDQSCGGNVGGGTLSASYHDVYDWENIPNQAYPGSPEEVRHAVAELCYEVGVMVEMDYGVCGSGAYTSDVVNILPAYMHYKDQILAENRIHHSPETWFQEVVDEINLGRPMVYRITGHAIVCDGWRDNGGINQYHMNYGWGGSYNTWFAIDDLHISEDPMQEVMYKRIEPDYSVHVLRDDGTGDFPTIQAAIDAAESGHVIVLEDGIYSGEGNRDLDFGSKNLELISLNLDPALCTIDCGGSAAEPHRAVYMAGGQSSESLLQGLTIVGGYADPTLPGGDAGGALLLDGASPMIIDCIFQNNLAGSGGAIAAYGSTFQTEEVAFYDNTAAGDGGAILLASGSDATLEELTCAFNTAGDGGAIACDQSSPSLFRVTLAGNEAATAGSGLYLVNASSPTIERTILAFGTGGGAIHCEGDGNSPLLGCTDIYGNLGGDWTGCIADQAETGFNLSVDPLFCDLDNYDFTLWSISECAWQNNPDCPGIGAHMIGCEPSGEAVCCANFSCYIVTYDECEAMDGTFLPSEDTCDPNPCYPPGTDLSAGVFIAHSPATAQYSPGMDWCQEYADQYAITSTEEQYPRIDSYGDVKIWYVLGAWEEERGVCGYEFGLGDFDPTVFYFTEWGNCSLGGSEFSTSNWPGPNEGTSLGYSDTMTGSIVPIYWFAGYAYYSGQVPLTVNSDTGFGGFKNCLDPVHSFDATCFGALGVNTDGVECHVGGGAEESACCIGTDCYIYSEEDCTLAGGVWQGADISCDPNPCEDPSGIEQNPAAVTRLSLSGNLPNPFAASTQIAFAVPNSSSSAALKVYDATGALVRTLWSGPVTSGRQIVSWDGKNEAGQQAGTGIYFYRLEAGDQQLTERMILVK